LNIVKVDSVEYQFKKTEKMNKPVYTISAAAELAGISVHTLRKYEKEGLIIPDKHGNHQRRYDESDIERIRCIRHIIQDHKVNIEAIRRLFSHIPCWAITNCPLEERNKCKAFNGYFKPCWMLNKKHESCKNRICRECGVYSAFISCGSIKDKLKQLLI
jgi:MerR family transcriptional regulator/heat shock protein HspR